MRIQRHSVSEILVGLLALNVFFTPVSTAPHRVSHDNLVRRTYDTAGIGVEVELGDVVVVAKRQLSAEELEEIKGKPMKPLDLDWGDKTHWELTAEISSGTIRKTLMPEAIVDGQQNKLGAHQTGKIGQEIFDFVEHWSPHASSPISIPGFDEELGPFQVKWPAPVKDPEKWKFSPQVTTAMPLAAVLEILRDTKNDVDNVLGSKGSSKRSQFVIATKDDFSSFERIKESDITDDFLGYLSLLATYCVLAQGGNPREGPKHLVSIMPRTDFYAQYKMFVESKIMDQLEESSLFDIVRRISGAEEDLAKDVFKWTPRTTTPVDDDWNGKQDDLKSGTLQVKKFLNYLQGWDPEAEIKLPQKDLVRIMDKALRHGQIGGLGSKMEKILDSNDRPAAIFEFRDLDSIYGSDLRKRMGAFEDKAIEYHRKFKEEVIEDKPSKGMALSIAMTMKVSPHMGAPVVHNEWEFYTTPVGKAVGSCGETEGERIMPQGPTDSIMDSSLSSRIPPWPAGIFKLQIEGEDCEYMCNGYNPGRLWCPDREIACYEDSAASNEDMNLNCTPYDFFHAVVYCDF